MLYKWLFSILFLLFITLASFIYFEHTRSIQTITYFPIDTNTSFTTASTKIALTSEKDQQPYNISWTSQSKSNKQVYLRQDASILFANGRLKGVASKWQENTDKIYLKKELSCENSSYFQAISFHYGEVHYPEDEIKSIQQMSHDALYVANSPTVPIEPFSTPQNRFTAEWKEKLDTTTKQQLIYHWNELMQHFQIASGDYHSIPLTSLYLYNERSLPAMSQAQTDQIIGKLWEGLYKNYIIPATSGTSQLESSYIPLVLVAKDRTHLLVLFQLDGKKEKLIQRIGN